jgi:hypothetical protein
MLELCGSAPGNTQPCWLQNKSATRRARSGVIFVHEASRPGCARARLDCASSLRSARFSSRRVLWSLGTGVSFCAQRPCFSRIFRPSELCPTKQIFQCSEGTPGSVDQQVRCSAALSWTIASGFTVFGLSALPQAILLRLPAFIRIWWPGMDSSVLSCGSRGRGR